MVRSSVVLPGPVRPDERDQLATANRQRDALERGDAAVADFEVLNFKHLTLPRLRGTPRDALVFLNVCWEPVAMSRP